MTMHERYTEAEMNGTLTDKDKTNLERLGYMVTDNVRTYRDAWELMTRGYRDGKTADCFWYEIRHDMTEQTSTLVLHVTDHLGHTFHKSVPVTEKPSVSELLGHRADNDGWKGTTDYLFAEGEIYRRESNHMGRLIGKTEKETLKRLGAEARHDMTWDKALNTVEKLGFSLKTTELYSSETFPIRDIARHSTKNITVTVTFNGETEGDMTLEPDRRPERMLREMLMQLEHVHREYWKGYGEKRI